MIPAPPKTPVPTQPSVETVLFGSGAGGGVAAGVLAESGNGLGFRHPLIRAALYDEIPAPLRAAWHRDVGRALAEAGAPTDRVARQLLRAADGSGIGGITRSGPRSAGSGWAGNKTLIAASDACR